MNSDSDVNSNDARCNYRKFRWKFNNSGEVLYLDSERYSKNGTRSILHYTPVTEQVRWEASFMSDGAMLHLQFISDNIHASETGLRNALVLGDKWDWRAIRKLLVPSGSGRWVASRADCERANWPSFCCPVLPSPVTNCTVGNQTREMAEVQCTSGYDGNLPQIFQLEVISRRSKAVK